MLGRRNGLFFFQLTTLSLLLSVLIYGVFLHDPGEPITENTEQLHQQGAPKNPFVAFLTGVGIIGVGVLGALYALARKETAALNSTIELMKRKLSENEESLAIYSRRLQSELQERIEEIRKVKEEDASLLNQLASAKNELKKLQVELQSEKKQEKDLKAHIDHLQSVIAQAGKDKQTLKAELQLKQDEFEFLQERISLLSSEMKDREISIENLSLSPDGRELECQKLTSIYNQTKEDLSQANSAVEGLNEASKTESLIAGLTRERDSLRTMLEKEANAVRNLRGELQITQDTLGASRLEAADFLKQLNQSERSLEDLTSEISRIQAEFAEAQKSLNHNLDEMKSKLSEKEAAMAITENNYKKRLQSEQEERSEEIRKVKEEVASLLNQLASANNELKIQSEKKQEQDLKAHIDHLQSVIAQAGEDKQTLKAELQLKQDKVEFLQERISLLSSEIKEKEVSIENLSLSLDEKELECKKLNSIYNQTKDNFSQANSAVEGLTEDARKIREELELKKSLEEDLNTKMKLLVAERDEINKKAHVLHEEYNDFKSTSGKREASDAKLLSNKESELNQLKEKLEIVLNEASKNQQRSDDLVLVEEDLKKTKQELLAMANESKVVAEDRENLKKELLEVSKKAETTARDLKEEREVVAALNMELKELRKHISKDKDARRELEKDLEETKKSLDEINRKALLLSRELELANSNNASLEKERDMLFKSLAEQKHTAKDIQVNLATSHKLLTELHEETENLEKRDQMLQVELASAKGEILRLRRELKKIYEEQQQTSRGDRGRGSSSRGPTSGTSQ